MNIKKENKLGSEAMHDHLDPVSKEKREREKGDYMKRIRSSEEKKGSEDYEGLFRGGGRWREVRATLD